MLLLPLLLTKNPVNPVAVNPVKPCQPCRSTVVADAAVAPAAVAVAASAVATTATAPTSGSYKESPYFLKLDVQDPLSNYIVLEGL